MLKCELGIFEVRSCENRIHLADAMNRKSTHTPEYKELLRLLAEERQSRRLRQSDVGAHLPFGQSGISKIESGERRLDVIELRMICAAMGMTLPDFVRKLEERLERLPAQEDASA